MARKPLFAAFAAHLYTVIDLAAWSAESNCQCKTSVESVAVCS